MKKFHDQILFGHDFSFFSNNQPLFSWCPKSWLSIVWYIFECREKKKKWSEVLKCKLRSRLLFFTSNPHFLLQKHFFFWSTHWYKWAREWLMADLIMSTTIEIWHEKCNFFTFTFPSTIGLSISKKSDGVLIDMKKSWSKNWI